MIPSMFLRHQTKDMDSCEHKNLARLIKNEKIRGKKELQRLGKRRKTDVVKEANMRESEGS